MPIAQVLSVGLWPELMPVGCDYFDLLDAISIFEMVIVLPSIVKIPDSALVKRVDLKVAPAILGD